MSDEERCTCGAAAEVAGGHLADCPFYTGWLRPSKEDLSEEQLADEIKAEMRRDADA